MDITRIAPPALRRARRWRASSSVDRGRLLGRDVRLAGERGESPGRRLLHCFAIYEVLPLRVLTADGRVVNEVLNARGPCSARLARGVVLAGRRARSAA